MYDRFKYTGQIVKHKSHTEWYWLTDQNVDYSNFDFDYHVPKWEEQFIHAFGDQHSVHAGTFLVHVDHDTHSDFKYIEHQTQRTSPFDIFESTTLKQNASTEWYWVTSPYNNYENFDFTWHPEIWEKNFVHVFPDQHCTHGGTYMIHKDCDLKNIEYKYHNFVIERTSYDENCWQLDLRNDYIDFDFTWHPEPWEEKYVHCFGDQHSDDSKTYYVADGVDVHNTRKHYHPNAVKCVQPFPQFRTKLKNVFTTHEYYWIVNEANDYTNFDFTWHPDEWQSKYVHYFGDQYSDDSGTYLIHKDTDVKNARIQYHPKTVTRQQEFEKFHVKGLQKCDSKQDWYWIVDDANDYQNFDFKWHPESWKGRYVHCFGDQHSDDANTYLVPKDCDLDNVKVEYHNHAFRRVKPWDRFKISGLKTVDSSTDWYWIISDENDYTGFDFTWHPESWQTKYVHCFGDQHADDSNTYLVHKSHDITNIRWQYHPKSVTRTGKYDIIKYDGNLNHHDKATTDFYWLVSDENDYSDFDFTWHPESAQRKFVHVFGDQFSETSGTYLINKALDPNDCRQQFHENKVVRKTTGTIHRCSNMMPGDDGTRLFSNLYNFIKRIANNSDERNIWITASIVNDKNFDYRWHPADWESKYIHVFHNEATEYGYVMWVPLQEFKKQMDSLAKLEWYNTIKYHPHDIQYFDLPVNTYALGDTLAEKIKAHNFTHHYEWFVQDKTLPNFYPSRWDDINIEVFGNSTLCVPREAKSYIMDQVYDYPHINKNLGEDTTSKFPIYFFSYGEKNADENFDKLKARGIDAIRIDGIEGQVNAFKHAASKCTSPYFWAVFAKSEVVEDFNFAYEPDRLAEAKFYCFDSEIPLNGLRYGAYGLVLYNTKIVKDATDWNADFTTSFPFEFVPTLSTIANFNKSAYMTWRAAFKECAKLSNGYIKMTDSKTNEERLNVWCTQAKGDFADYCLQGANQGKKFGAEANEDEMLQLLDEKFLQERFTFLYNDLENPVPITT